VQCRPAVTGHLRERDRSRPAEAERLRHGRRPVHEVGAGREQLEPDAMPDQRVQREQRLQRRDTAAGDEDLRSLGHDQAGTGASTRSASSTSRFA
jgi:hypothetical protein